MENKYYNEAIIGNKNIVASFSKKGEMLRLFYPTRDYKQFIETMHTGVKVNDSAIIYLHEDINNEYEQYYTEDTNIINTKIKNTYFNLVVLQTDFVPISKDIIIKKLIFKNENNIDLNVNFLIYSKLLSNHNNMVSSKIENNILMQYTHDYTFSIFSKTPILGYRLNNSSEDIKGAVLHDKDYIGMANDSAVSFDIGVLKPGESKEIEIFIHINDNKEKYKFDEIIEEIEKIRKIDTKKELESTKKYWEEFVKSHDGLEIFTKPEKWQKLITGEEQTNEATYKKYLEMRKIYTRSILLFPLLSNEETGGISAAIEIDENRTKSGRYSYCWPRDAVFVTKALDILKMHNQTTKFYTDFSKQTQSKNGMWEQRFYTDKKLAPCWGYQIDETASIVYGVYEHYKATKDKNFLKETYEMCQKAIDALGTFLNASSVPFASQKNKLLNDEFNDSNASVSFENLSDEERFITYESYDLWEMNEGIHLYSLSAIYSAFKAMAQIKRELNIDEGIEELENNAESIKNYCLNNFYDRETKTLKRNNKDNITDISTLGVVVPFEMLDKNDEIVKHIIEKIDLNLRTYTGGYIRFENDNYLGGNNPWPIATLWMALYNLQTKKIEEARKQVEFVIKTATNNGFLAEQVNNENMQAKWVIGLGWSHAMYIIVLSQLGTVPNWDKWDSLGQSNEKIM